MNTQMRWIGATTTTLAAVALATLTTLATPPRPAIAEDCPGDGTVRIGVEPFDTSPRLTPIYERIGAMISEKLGCPVRVFVATNYNAEIEAMRNGKLEIGEFGPLGYVLAHQIAKAEAVAAFSNKEGKPDSYWASLVTSPTTGHQDGRRYSRSLFRILRSGFDLRASVPRLRACAKPASIRTRTSRRSMPAATPLRSKRSIITRSMSASSTASSLNRRPSAATTRTATWYSCGSPTRSRPIRSRSAATSPTPSRSG